MHHVNDDENCNRIAHFYTGRSVFITGASGFMGKVLVEKLLRSCDGIKNIYLLLRTKKDLNANERLEELLDSKIFETIKEESPKLLHKLVSIHGDITLPGLGISQNDLNTLINDVSIVYHSAATVRFDETLKTAANFNLIGTLRLIDLCHKLPNLVALIHVSTAYANCNRHKVDEILYPSPVSPDSFIDTLNWMDDDIIDLITPKLIGDWPNTYTYTKALAETLLAKECGQMPVAIVRPSIVTAAWKEPFPGWVDNINGPTGVILASGKGVLRTMLFNGKCCADLIPVDTVINLMIAVSWYTATKHPKNIMIYNCTSGSINKLIWSEIEKIGYPLLLQYPSTEVYRYPGGSFKESRFVNELCCFFDHLIPAYLTDGFMTIIGRKRMMVKLYDKIHRAVGSLEWFTTHEWEFTNDNVLMLLNELNKQELNEFSFDIRELEWKSYWETYVLGARKYLLGEDDSTLPKARSNLRRDLWSVAIIRDNKSVTITLTKVAQ